MDATGRGDAAAASPEPGPKADITQGHSRAGDPELRAHSARGAWAPSTPEPTTPTRLQLARPPSASSSVRVASRGMGGGRATSNLDTSLISMLRRQQEIFEEKILAQIGQMRLQSDRLREASLQRLEDKLGNMEAAQAKNSRGLAELNGKFRGVSDEIQAQIRRSDAVEERLTESRRHMEDSFRKRHAELEDHIKKVAKDLSQCGSQQEDFHHRQQQKSQKLHEDVCSIRQSLDARVEQLEARIDEVAQAKLDEIDVASALAVQDSQPRAWGPVGGGVEDYASASHLSILERRLSDIGRKLEETSQDSSEVRERLATQEQQLRTLALKMDSREEVWRELKDRVDRGDWEGKLEQLRKSLQEETRKVGDHEEQLNRFARKMEMAEQAHEQLEERFVASKRQAADGEDAPAPAAADTAEIFLQVQELRDIVETLRMKADINERAQEQLQERFEMAPRIVSLITHLQDLVPKIVQQEQRLGEIEAKVMASAKTLEEWREQAVLPTPRQQEDSTKGAALPADAVKGLEQRVAAVEQAARDAGERTSTVEEIAGKLAEVEKASGTVDELRKKVAELEQAAREAGERSSSFGELAQRVAAVEQATRDAGERGGADGELQQKIASVEQVFQQRVTAVEQAVREVGERGGAVEELQRKVAEVEQTARGVERSVQAGERSGAMEELERKVTAVEQAVRAAGERSDGDEELQRKVAAMEQAVHEAGERISAVQVLEQKVIAMEQAVQAAGERNGGDEDLQRKIAAVEQVVREASERSGAIGEIERKVATIDQSVREAGEHKGAIEELERKVTAVEQAVRDVGERRGADTELQQKVTAVEQAVREAGEHKGVIEELERKVTAVELAVRAAGERGSADSELQQKVTAVEQAVREAGERSGVFDELKLKVTAVEQAVREAGERSGAVDELQQKFADMEKGLRDAEERGGALNELRQKVAAVEEVVKSAGAGAVEELERKLVTVEQGVRNTESRDQELSDRVLGAIASMDKKVLAVEEALSRSAGSREQDPQIENLRADVCQLQSQGAASALIREEMAALQKEVQRLAEATPPAATVQPSGTLLGAEEREMLTGLLDAARRDQEAESEANGRLLDTVDQLCSKLAAMEKAL